MWLAMWLETWTTTDSCLVLTVVLLVPGPKPTWNQRLLLKEAEGYKPCLLKLVKSCLIDYLPSRMQLHHLHTLHPHVLARGSLHALRPHVRARHQKNQRLQKKSRLHLHLQGSKMGSTLPICWVTHHLKKCHQSEFMCNLRCVLYQGKSNFS